MAHPATPVQFGQLLHTTTKGLEDWKTYDPKEQVEQASVSAQSGLRLVKSPKWPGGAFPKWPGSPFSEGLQLAFININGLAGINKKKLEEIACLVKDNPLVGIAGAYGGAQKCADMEAHIRRRIKSVAEPIGLDTSKLVIVCDDKKTQYGYHGQGLAVIINMRQLLGDANYAALAKTGETKTKAVFGAPVAPDDLEDKDQPQLLSVLLPFEVPMLFICAYVLPRSKNIFNDQISGSLILSIQQRMDEVKEKFGVCPYAIAAGDFNAELGKGSKGEILREGFNKLEMAAVPGHEATSTKGNKRYCNVFAPKELLQVGASFPTYHPCKFKSCSCSTAMITFTHTLLQGFCYTKVLKTLKYSSRLLLANRASDHLPLIAHFLPPSPAIFSSDLLDPQNRIDQAEIRLNARSFQK